VGIVPAELSLPDRYHLMGHVASGGMAAVYAARDELLGREVAVKVLAEHLNLDPGAKLRFQREARAAAGLSSHPHVVTIYDVGEHAGRSFIVMELLRRGSLAQVLRSGRDVADRPTAVGWLRDAASALDAAHAAGIVHRDVKPANLLLDDRGGMVMADFGIARIAQEDQLTQTGQVLGTAAYLSPEQALGEPATAASDRYALAVVAFELLTGRRPFTAEHFAAQARAHIEDPPPRAGDIRPDLPPGVEAVLERGLAKAPEDRWPTAGAFVDALDEALAEPEEEPTRAMAPLPPPRAEPVTPEPRPVPRRSPRRERSFVAAEAPQQPRRGPGRWVALLAVLLALVAGGVAIAALSGEGDAKRDSSRAARDRTPTPTAEASPDATATPADTPEATEPTATATPTASPTPSPTAAATSAPTGGSAASNNNRGFTLYQAGKYAEAVTPLQQAVEQCGASKELDPCGYAIYNYGSSLHRAGRSAEAIPLLERRLADFSFQRGVVRKELAAAKKAAGAT